MVPSRRQTDADSEIMKELAAADTPRQARAPAHAVLLRAAPFAVCYRVSKRGTQPLIRRHDPLCAWPAPDHRTETQGEHRMQLFPLQPPSAFRYWATSAKLNPSIWDVAGGIIAISSDWKPLIADVFECCGHNLRNFAEELTLRLYASPESVASAL